MAWALAVLVAVMLAAGPPAVAASAEAARVKALIVGVAEYRKLPKKEHLPRAAIDAAGIRDLLVGKLGVAPGNIRVLGEPGKASPTRDELKAAWRAHLDSLAPGDMSIVFFSGHGMEHDKQPHLLLSDFDRDKGSGGVPLLGLVDAVKDKSGKILGVFIVDACRQDAGSAKPADAKPGDDWTGGRKNSPLESGDSFAPVRAPKGMFILYAASTNQIALHDLGPGDDSNFSVYTRVLLAALENPDRGLHEIAKDVRWKTHELALGRKGPDGKPKRHLQVPAYFDDMLQRHNILGAELPATALAVPGGVRGPLASAVGKSIEWPCPNCPEMVEVPLPGEAAAVRGAVATDGGARLTRRYAIGKHEVTRDEWRACQIEGKCSILDRDILEGDRRPIAGVSWDDAQRFVAWLNAKPGLGGFRLPTEAEWEHAARGGTHSDFGPAHEPRQLCDYANGADASLKSLLWANTSCSDGKGREVAPAGSYRANGFDIHDMLGNVWEWVADCADASSPCRRRVAKGGSWRSGPDATRISAFRALDADEARATVGFRVARDIE